LRALDRGASGRNQGFLELVLRAAAVAGYVHVRFEKAWILRRGQGAVNFICRAEVGSCRCKRLGASPARGAAERHAQLRLRTTATYVLTEFS
jgi:hypothetical protein